MCRNPQVKGYCFGYAMSLWLFTQTHVKLIDAMKEVKRVDSERVGDINSMLRRPLRDCFAILQLTDTVP
jgi:hypothetical protein